ALRENLEHIKDTVAMQQKYAKRCGVTEIVLPADLVEDSLRLNAGALERHGVTLRREFNEVPAINVDRHKVLQILVNLIRNAKYACDDSGRPDKLIILRIESAGHGVRISVIDNGIGISPENMARLFSHGFTTRASGHGFGLHSAVLAAQELGGSLHAQSAGPGCGATFVLELPIASAEDAIAA
ncbi:MAG TPA: ATP-binding protein, partial [Steroidobacteraceae bacterium]|nr:ATP-binding protein [Steroidobacteraceae bacterium]